VAALARPGRYRLRWDLVRESVTWFSERGNPTADQLIDVVAAESVPRARPLSPLAGTLEEAMALPTPSRPELWRAAVQLWRRHPLLGVGPDNFRHLYPQAMVLPPGQRRFNDERLHANSLYFETLADLGLAGVAALALLMGTLVQAGRARRAQGQLVGLACALGAGTFFVHGLLDTFFAFTPLYGLCWLLLGLTGTLQGQTTTASPDSKP
jgi:O-antigen ligase